MVTLTEIEDKLGKVYLLNADGKKKLDDKGNPVKMTKTSIKGVLDNVGRLSRVFNQPDIQELLKDCDQIIDYIENYKKRDGKAYEVNSKKTFFININTLHKYKIVKLPKECEKRYNDHMMTHYETAQKEFEENNPSPAVKEFDITWDDIVAAFNKSYEHDKASMETVTMAMYVLIPPRRGYSDYGALNIYYREGDEETRKKENYIVLHKDSARMVINDFKTVNKFGPYTTDLPKKLVEIIQESLKKLKRKYVITNNNGHQFRAESSYSKHITNTFTKYIKKVKAGFDKTIGNQELRKLYVTHFTKNINKYSEAERERIAVAMAHSKDMQMHYRNKDQASNDNNEEQPTQPQQAQANDPPPSPASDTPQEKEVTIVGSSPEISTQTDVPLLQQIEYVQINLKELSIEALARLAGQIKEELILRKFA